MDQKMEVFIEFIPYSESSKFVKIEKRFIESQKVYSVMFISTGSINKVEFSPYRKIMNVSKVSGDLFVSIETDSGSFELGHLSGINSGFYKNLPDEFMKDLFGRGPQC